LNTFKYLHENGCPCDKQKIYDSIEENNCKEYGRKWSLTKTYDSTAVNNRLEILKYLHEN